MKTRDEDGSLRDGWELLVELEARYLPLAATAETVMHEGTYDSDQASFALACGCRAFLTDLREVRDAISELEHRYKKTLGSKESIVRSREE